MVRLAGLPLGLTVASWKNVEYFSSLLRSRDLSSALRHGAVADMTLTCSNPFPERMRCIGVQPFVYMS